MAAQNPDDMRRLVYELLLEIKGLQDSSAKAQQEFKKVTASAKETEKTLKGIGKLAGLGFSIQALSGISTAIDKAYDSLRSFVGGLIDGVASSAQLHRQLQDLDDVQFETTVDKWTDRLGALKAWIDDNYQRLKLVYYLFGDYENALRDAAAAQADLNRQLAERNRLLSEPLTIDTGADFYSGAQYYKGGQKPIDYEDIAKQNLASLSQRMQAQDKEMQAIRARQQKRFDEWIEMQEALERNMQPGGAAYRRLHPTDQPRAGRGDEQVAQTFKDAQTYIADTIALEIDAAAAAQEIETSWLKMPEPIEDASASLEEFSLTAQDTASVMAHAFMGIFTGAAHNARDFFRLILEGFAEVFAQKAALQIGSLFGEEATGGAYSSGVRLGFARGGVVGGPTMFAMGGGRYGVMGEAGPEAIMPLKRGPDGKLGVGASGAAPSVQIINNTGVAATARVTTTNERMQIVLEAADMGRSMALEEVNRSLRTGYGDTAQSVQRTYGLRRRG